MNLANALHIRKRKNTTGKSCILPPLWGTASLTVMLVSVKQRSSRIDQSLAERAGFPSLLTRDYRHEMPIFPGDYRLVVNHLAWDGLRLLPRFQLAAHAPFLVAIR